jgi:hypothetical protein
MYGRSPMMDDLPSLQVINEMTRAFLARVEAMRVENERVFREILGSIRL